jgi:hypothetical protein
LTHSARSLGVWARARISNERERSTAPTVTSTAAEGGSKLQAGIAHG